MRLIADLHIHSRFSRATSRELCLAELHAWAQRKGIGLLGTGDITHPTWLEELSEQLVPAEEGLFRLRPELEAAAIDAVAPACRAPVRFVLQGEISCIYKHGDRVRKVHSVVFCPDFAAARRLLGTLDRLGNVRSDGRPILGLSSRDLLEIVLEAGPGACLVPAHVWTPWFSLLGSKSGYDSVEACFGDLSGEIFALETGLSSDPAMNWRVSGLDRYALLSNSDAHSAANLGREANEFELEPSYGELFASLRSPGDTRFRGTLEFFPEEGKYHLDGHRSCGRRLTPQETQAAGGRCPACGAKVTVGVLHRVEELADRPDGRRPEGARDFARLVPLAELVGECLGVGSRSARVRQVSQHLEREIGPELMVLRNVPLEELRRRAGPVVSEGVARVRREELHIAPGYDGEFGTVRLFRPEERAELAGRRGLHGLGIGGVAPEETELPHPTGPRGPIDPMGPLGPIVPDGVLERVEEGAGPRPPEAFWGLNDEQQRAVVAPPRPLAIIAGPGTGKTKTVSCRIAHKVRSGQVRPEQVLAVTFTNRAATELGERLAGLLGERAARIRVCTLHRLALDLLREECEAAGLPADFAILGSEECRELLRSRTGLGAAEAEAALTAISLARRRSGGGEGDLRSDLPAWELLEATLLEAGAVDLDGLVPRALGVLEASADVRGRWQRRFAHVVVDEFQDLDPVQYRFLALLAPGDADLTVIGDPDQAIYGFRGAEPHFLARFAGERAGGTAVELVRNYRSCAPVLEAALRMLSSGVRSARRELRAVERAGPPVRVVTAPSDRLEAEHVAREVERIVGGTSHDALRRSGGGYGDDAPLGFGDVAVLYRLRAQRQLLEEAFQRAGIPCRAAGEEPLFLRGKGREVLRRLRKEEPAAAAARIVGRLLEGAGLSAENPSASAWFAAASAAGTVGALLERVSLHTPEDDWEPRAERVALLTLHAAKGLEFEAVFIVGCEEGLIPFRSEGDDREVDLEEERRLLYVGMTRARKFLCLTRSERRLLYGKTQHPRRSGFLADLGAVAEERLPDPSGDKPRQLALL